MPFIPLCSRKSSGSTQVDSKGMLTSSFRSTRFRQQFRVPGVPGEDGSAFGLKGLQERPTLGRPPPEQAVGLNRSAVLRSHLNKNAAVKSAAI